MQAQCAGCERPQDFELLQRITAAAERLDKLIRDAIRYSRLLQQRPLLVPVDLDKLLRERVASSFNLQPSVAEFVIDGPLPIVLGSEEVLTQCFKNLFDNAIKFVAPGVKPRIHVWAEEMPSGSGGQPPPGEAVGGSRGVEAAGVSTQASALAEQAPRSTQDEADAALRMATLPRVRLWVQDNGIGIAPEHQTHIFEMFHRLDQQHEGTGIGLAIVFKAVERLGGRVGLESAVGSGSKFWVELRPADPSWSGGPMDREPTPC
jgi:signal transduction histidine kinase